MNKTYYKLLSSNKKFELFLETEDGIWLRVSKDTAKLFSKDTVEKVCKKWFYIYNFCGDKFKFYCAGSLYSLFQVGCGEFGFFNTSDGNRKNDALHSHIENFEEFKRFLSLNCIDSIQEKNGTVISVNDFLEDYE